MLLHVEDAVEALPAVVAAEGLFAGVLPLVFDEVGACVVGLGAAGERALELARRPRLLRSIWPPLVDRRLLVLVVVDVLDVVPLRALREELHVAPELGAVHVLVPNLANVLLEVSEGRRDDGVPAQLAAGGHRHRDHYLL